MSVTQVIINCEFYIVSKVYKIVLRKLPTNKTTRPFYRVYIDLFLEIIVYNSDNYIIYFFNEFSQMNEVETFA